MNFKKLEIVFLFLVLLLLPTQLGKHFWPEFSFIYSLPVDYLSPTVYLWDILVVILLAVSFFSNYRGLSRSTITIILIFLLTQAFSLLLVNEQRIDIGAGLVRFEQYLIGSAFAIYLANKNFNFLKKHIFWPLSIGLLFVSCLGIGQFFNQGTLGFWIFGERTFSLSTPAIAKFDFYGQQFLRPYATFPHPNVLSAYIIMILPLLMLFIAKPIQRWIFNFTMVVSAIALFLTVSRIAIIGAFTELVFFINKNTIQVIKEWKILVPLVVVLSLIIPLLYTRFSSTLTFDVISLSRREGLESLAIKLFLESPLTGFGLNNFVPVIAEQLITGPSRFLQPVHNIFLLSLSETGIIGFLGLCLLIGSPVFYLLKNSLNKDSQVLLLIWMIIIFLGFFDHYLLTLPQGYRMLFLVWGISMSSTGIYLKN